MATETLYLRADEIKPGDILPDVSRSTVTRVIVDPRSHVTFRFNGTEFTRTARYGGSEYGYECFRVERTPVESAEDYALACDAQHAADPTHTPTTSNDAECDLCGRAVHIAPYSGELVHGYDPTMGE
ncbi:hypothetical protein SEA_MUSETTA_4 [Microbacterium phage Musetta]|nr:hypothetical protein SEA_MUSETTA_117 [Microbacterium phage Musetta]AXH50271.1 hypothetical protein SEA_MUSETTA_4 [Microbacterium phage Musetta]QYC54126.1 hypothetical protein SEA_WELCOME_4 [Microbacterium phage Welcome]QYC54238.1 hypothetical protein SEA_WELCOME_121 [Microbacterium phage Welcome]